MSSPLEELPEHVRRNRVHWGEWAKEYVAPGERNWRATLESARKWPSEEVWKARLRT